MGSLPSPGLLPGLVRPAAFGPILAVLGQIVPEIGGKALEQAAAPAASPLVVGPVVGSRSETAFVRL